MEEAGGCRRRDRFIKRSEKPSGERQVEVRNAQGMERKELSRVKVDNNGASRVRKQM